MLQQYCLRWKYHHSNLQTMFSQLLDRGCFCDVTLACEEKTIRAHRVVLCACSTYFDSILTNCDYKEPIIIMKDAKFADIKCLIEFMYKGEINVEHSNLASLLKTAEELKIKGLAEVSWRNEDHHNHSEVIGKTDLRENLSSNNNLSIRSLNDNNAIPSPNFLPSISATVTSTSQPNPATFPNDFSPRPSRNPGVMPEQSFPNLPLLAPIRIQPNDSNHIPTKKKRGRPPLDGEFDNYNSPKERQPSYPPNFPSSMVETSSPTIINTPPAKEPEKPVQDPMLDDPYLKIVPKLERPDTPDESELMLDQYEEESVPFRKNRSSRSSKKRRSDYHEMEYKDDIEEDFSNVEEKMQNQSVILTQQDLEEWSDVVKMTDYLTNGRRPQFWEEAFTKRVMDAIKTKNLEMKKAAQLLGVSYGTLYGRYRETYGCLKHPYRGPFMTNRMQNMWGHVDQNPSDLMNMFQRNSMSMHRGSSSNDQNFPDHDPLELDEISHSNLRNQLQNQGVTLSTE